MISNISLITLTFCVKPCSVFQPFCFGGISFVDFYGVTGIVWGLSDEKQIGARLEKEIEMYCSNKALERLKDIVARDSHRIAHGRTIENNDILHKYWDFFTTYSRDKATLDVHRLFGISSAKKFYKSEYFMFEEGRDSIWLFLILSSF